MTCGKRIVCLANSLKTGGTCIAGREILPNGVYGGWIRPVSSRPTAELSFIEPLYANNESPRLLDVIDVPLCRAHPDRHQSENHLIDTSRPWVKLGRLHKAKLGDLCDNPASLWIDGEHSRNGRNNCVSDKKAAMLKNSLYLIQAPRLAVQVSAGSRKDDARFKYKGNFIYNAVGYFMTLTDPVVIDYLCHKGIGKYHFEDVYLTVSLTEPFAWDNRCHKLIASRDEKALRLSAMPDILYTIGHSNHPIEHLVRVDVRLNNVSQLAGFAKKNDLAWFTKTICNIDYVHVPSLAPTKDILDAYKKHKGDWDLYERQFIALMQTRKIEDTTPLELLDGACLLCSEETPHHCHRRLVTEYLREKWGNIDIEHIP